MYTYTGTATKRQHYWRHVKAIQNQSKQRVANGSKAREIIVDECTLSKRKNIDATKEKQHRIGPSTKKQRLTFIQWPFQVPKLKVPTIYKAYFSGLCKGISRQNMAHMDQYLHFRVLKFPLIATDAVNEAPRDTTPRLWWSCPSRVVRGSATDLPAERWTHVGGGHKGAGLKLLLTTDIYIFIQLYLYLYIYLFICLYIYSTIYLYINMYLSLYLYLNLYLSIYRSIYLYTVYM